MITTSKDSPRLTAPSVSLPKGGGAIRGIGEKLAANPATGTGAMSVPIATSPGRSGFGPALSLSYDSGSGNGPFGFGWSLSLPEITRKTDKGLPRYADAAESDVFLLSGVEDLVPVDRPDEEIDGYRVRWYRPRVEGLFARIERWTRIAAPADVHWRSLSRDNVLTVYGLDAGSRIADPLDPARIFSWLACETRDDRGNAVVYGYKADDGLGVDPTSAHERHRGPAGDVRRTANRYLKRVRYGNRVSLLDPVTGGRPRFLAEARVAAADWMFEVVFDYGDHDPSVPAPRDDELPAHAWPARPDSFSSYRAGFEVRTTRLCRRVLMFHHFPDEPDVGRDCLVRSTDLAHSGDMYMFLRSVTQYGYSGDERRGLPPVEFDYSEPVLRDTIADIDPQSLENLPEGLDGATYRWTDLHGEGLPGILTEQGGAWFYKRNLSPLPDGRARFAPLATVAHRPNAALGDGAQIMDLAGDGRPDVVLPDGLYEHDGVDSWRPFRPFTSLVNLDLEDHRLVDLDGDGRADLLVGEHAWHPSEGEAGFGPARRVDLAEEAGSTHLADLSGDGLTDLVRIRNGEVCYWPNLGHGRFGAKVTMDNAPWFDRPDEFDPRRLRLADIDGSGTTDIVYLRGDGGVDLYFNRSGDAWSAVRRLTGFPPADDSVSVLPVDLLGNGTACLVWSAEGTRRPMRYLNLLEGKPHLLVRTDNNLGAETRVEYAPSTRFQLQDRRDGRPWPTRLPMPVHVVERVTTYDHIGRNRFVTRYAYHDGYFDGEEREFRGFGMVEQWDTEATGGGEAHVPPMRTKTWFHTGAPADPTADREAERALKGSVLRQEVYADDGGPDADLPYSAVEHSYTVRTVQPRGPRRHGVFLVHPRETLTYQYERHLDDPRIGHTLTLDVDPYGNVLKRATVGYGRDPLAPGLAELAEPDRAGQTATLVTYTENAVTEDVDTRDAYRTPLPCESVTFELTGYPAGRFRAEDLVEPGPDGRLRHRFTNEVGFEQEPAGVRCRRPIGRTRTLYRADDLTALLPAGQVGALALPGETYTLALTPGLLAGLPLPDPAVLEAEGGYTPGDGGTWWVPSGRSFFTGDPDDDPATELAAARRHFFLARRTRDPFGQDSTVDLDGYDLLPVETRDALGNRVTVEANDYRVLQPRLISDPNRNRTEVAFDTLGFVVGTAVMGKPAPAPAEGDTLAGFAADLTQAQLDSAFDGADPRAGAAALLRDASTRILYDLDRFRRTRLAHPTDPTRWLPAGTATLARETHVGAPPPPHGSRIQLSFSYSDGFGREIQKKLPAEQARWVGNGWTIYNNKGLPVRRYEPFFTADHRFEYGVTAGVSPVLCYDPLGRAVATLHPNHTYEKVVFDAWRQVTHDVNDTCAADPRTDGDIRAYVVGHLDGQPGWQTWRELRAGGGLGQRERDAADRATAHAGTPTTVHLDALGRPLLTVIRNRVVCAGHDLDGTEETTSTRVQVDIQGNTRAVGDERGRTVMRYDHDLLGNVLRQDSVDAGTRWTLTDVAGQPIRGWDGRGHAVTTGYDALRRPVRRTVRGTSADSDPRTLGRDVLVDRIEYGEPPPTASQADQDLAIRLNLRTRVLRHFDTSGVVTNARLDAGGVPVAAYDFKGNPLWTTRRLAADYTALPDWSLSPLVMTETHLSGTRYDALNRPIQTIAPHSSRPRALRTVAQPSYNEASLLERVDVWLERTTEPDGLLDPAVEAPDPVGLAGVEYDAKGQRLRVDYQNGTGTSYTYDPLTFRLTGLRTDGGLQDLHYTYDPAGNTTHIRDDAQQTVFFRNRRVEPSNDYTYDARYRLVQGTGREHLGQLPVDGLDHPGDGDAMGAYVERYTYDAVGNIARTRHVGSDPAHPGWTRAHEYAAASNRLTGSTLDPDGANPLPEAYTYDPHGNMVRLPHLGAGAAGPNTHWDPADRLRRTDLGTGTAYYVYDAAGHRVRKVWEKSPGLVEERIYLGTVELFRRHDGPIGTDTSTLERGTLHVMDGPARIALVETRTLDTAGTDPAPRRLVRFQLGNHLASAALELDELARIVSYEEYSPFGSTTYYAVRSRTETPKRYRYTGKERDEETGLAYHGARYYAPWLGRWVSCDPMGLVDGGNLYAYARNSPVRYSDPTGTQSFGGFGPMGPPMPEVDIVTRYQLWQMGAMRKEAEQELEAFYAGGNTGPESEQELADLQQKSAILDTTLTAQAVMAALGAVRNGMSSRAPVPAPPPPNVSKMPAPPPAPVSPGAGSAAAQKLLPAGTVQPQQKLLPAGTVPPPQKLLPAGTVQPPQKLLPAGPEQKLLTAGTPVAPQPAPPGPVPPQFRVGKAGETMANYSAANSPVGGPTSLAQGQFTLKDASGKTALPNANSGLGARKPDTPIKAQGTAVGTVEVKTPYGGAPQDPVDYVRLRPNVANQMSNERKIMSQGGITWGPAGGPQTPVEPGQGIGVTTGYWQWKPPWDFQ